MFNSGSWGAVCDDYFDMNDNAATVVCNQLGYPGLAFAIPFRTYSVLPS